MRDDERIARRANQPDTPEMVAFCRYGVMVEMVEATRRSSVLSLGTRGCDMLDRAKGLSLLFQQHARMTCALKMHFIRCDMAMAGWMRSPRGYTVICA